MMKGAAGLMAKSIEGVLEFSAHAQASRREVAKDSPAYHNLTGAIAAYGKVLALLTSLEQREEFDSVIGLWESCEVMALVG